MSSDNIYNINKPLIKDKTWMIFQNSTFHHLETMDCNDTMTGECYYDKTFDQCIQSCKDNPECNFGYYISDTPNKKNICVPLRDANINSNPVYRLRTQDIYKELDGARSTVFINKNKHAFPPEQANTVFFKDNFMIENIETKMSLETSPISSNESEPTSQSIVEFSKNGDHIVQALQISADTEYIPLKYGDRLAFHIPNTTLVMRSDDNIIEWVVRSFSISQHSAFYLKPLTPGRKIGDDVKYSDIFSIHADVSILSINGHANIEQLYYESHSKAKDKGANVTFRFIPKMKGWYCNNDAQCTEIPLEKMVIDNKGIGTYDGLAVGRNPGCWGVCKYKVKNQPHLKPLEEYEGGEGGDSYSVLWFIIPIILVLIFIALKKY